ncbi:BTB/POZ domain-containing protein 3 [Orchesella cincta]|uniref:BTB/POZ domain-containing protein 3 n=1 Tax=Orchesella cincta TaxID=48709 RepID=A0A1D2MB38_ORCCI|nr:BTB/POZ domain-containing protein 3 [Orchesella cincta]
MNEVSLRLKMFSSVKRTADGHPTNNQQGSGSGPQQQELGGSTSPTASSTPITGNNQQSFTMQVDNSQVSRVVSAAVGIPPEKRTSTPMLTSVLHGNGGEGNALLLNQSQSMSLPTSPLPSPRSTFSTRFFLESGTSGGSSGFFGSGGVTTPNSQLSQSQNRVSVIQREDSGSTATLATPSSSSSKRSQDSTRELDWQSSKATVRERNSAMCNNELMSDVHFLVSNNGGEAQKFPAHKYVLATGSSVFYAMFYGTLAEVNGEIVVPDVEPDAFLKMLRYLYADEIDLDEDSVLPTLQVAKKYMIPHLARACVQFMEASLTARNACVLLCQSRIFDEPELMQRCWEVIDAQAEMALNAEGFRDIDYSTMESILSRETLNCKEIHVFNAAMTWSNAECERREINVTAENLRAALGSALSLIRVPTMELKEFADGPAQTGLYSLQEAHDIFLHFTATNKPHVAFSTIPRKGLKPLVCHRFNSTAYRSNQWRYRGRCDSIQFSVDRRIFVIGFGLYGSSSELKKQGRILAENDTEFFSDGSSRTFHVSFRQPVQIDPDVYYTASVILDGIELSYFGQEGMADVTVGNVMFQFQCSAESTNGTGVQGGQIPELIFYGPGTPS